MSPGMECNQKNIISQPSSCIAIVSDTHTTFSSNPVTALSVLTTNNNVITSISGQVISTVTTTTAGTYVGVHY